MTRCEVQNKPFKEFSQSVIRTYDVTRMPKWWRPEILRSYFFLIAYLDRNTALVPQDLKKDLDETLRLTIILCEEFVKAAVVPRNRFRRVCPPQPPLLFPMCCFPVLCATDLYGLNFLRPLRKPLVLQHVGLLIITLRCHSTALPTLSSAAFLSEACCHSCQMFVRMFQCSTLP